MGRIVSVAFVILLIAHLVPVSAESDGRDDTDPIEFPQINGMVLDQLDLNLQDLDFSPELTVPTPDGGIVALLALPLGGVESGEPDSFAFGDWVIQISDIDETIFPEHSEYCLDYHDEKPKVAYVLLWIDNDGEAYQMRELDLSNLPSPAYEWTEHNPPCRLITEPMAMDVRSDGLIGISFYDEFDWFDGRVDGYQIVAGYYDENTDTLEDIGTIHMPGLPNEKCYNPLLNEYVNTSWSCPSFEYQSNSSSSECHDYNYEYVYYDISEIECESFLWVPSGEHSMRFGDDGWEDNPDANTEGDPYFVYSVEEDYNDPSTHLSFFGDDRIIVTIGDEIRWMEIGAQPEYAWDHGLGEEIKPKDEYGTQIEITNIGSMDCWGTSCVFTSSIVEQYGSDRLFTISNSLNIEQAWGWSIDEIWSEYFHIYDVTIGTDGDHQSTDAINYYISGMVEAGNQSSSSEVLQSIGCSSQWRDIGEKTGFVVSLNSDFNINWGSCSASGAVYPSRLASNNYGDIAMIGRYENSVTWGNQEAQGAGEGFILLLNDSSGEINHLWEIGDRIIDNVRIDGDPGALGWILSDASNGEFWIPFFDVETGDTGGFARIGIDDDNDAISNYLDNCPEVVNPGQLDSDSDGFGDDCDSFTSDITQWSDFDGDGFGDNSEGNQPDSCPSVSGTSDEDRNGCPDRDGDGWSDPDEDWTFEDGADQEPDDPQSHVDTTPPTVGFNWQVSDEDDQGGNLSVQITWSNSDWSEIAEANTPATLQIFASAERWDDCNVLQMVLELELDSQSDPPTSLLIGNLTNDVEYTVCISISDINDNKAEKGPEYVIPTMNQPPEYNGGLTAQNVDYGDSWKIDLCDYFTDEETECGNMTFTPSTNKISINTQELTAEWVPTASDNILENITISATDEKGGIVESNIFTIEVKVQDSGEDVLFTLDVPVMGELAVTSEQVIGTLGSVVAFAGTIGIAVIKLRSKRGKEKLVKRLSGEISGSTYSEQLDELMDEVEDALNNNKITDDQYSTLSIKINSARTRLSPSPNQQYDYNMPMSNTPAMPQHPPGNAASFTPQYPPMQAPGVATPDVNMRGQFNAEGFETLEYPSGSNKWFYRDKASGQWMAWE